MGWAEDRIGKAEASIEDLYRRLGPLADQLKALQQALRNLDQRLPQQGAGGDGGGVFVCMCPTAVNGTWTGGVPTSPGIFTADVYQVMGQNVGLLGSSPVANWMTASTTADLPCLLVKDAQGGYVVVSQSCS